MSSVNKKLNVNFNKYFNQIYFTERIYFELQGLFIDVGNNQSIVDQLDLSYVYSELGSGQGAIKRKIYAVSIDKGRWVMIKGLFKLNFLILNITMVIFPFHEICSQYLYSRSNQTWLIIISKIMIINMIINNIGTCWTSSGLGSILSLLHSYSLWFS